MEDIKPENIESTDSKIHLPQSNQSSCTKSKSNIFALDSAFAEIEYNKEKSMNRTSNCVNILRRHVSTGKLIKQSKKCKRRALSKSELPFALKQCKKLDEPLVVHEVRVCPKVKKTQIKSIKKTTSDNKRCHII